jgi:competence protein ComEC
VEDVISASLKFRGMDTLSGFVPIRAGRRLPGIPSLRIYVLWPPGIWDSTGVHARMNGNAGSVVLRVVYGNTSILLTGDAEREAELEMIEAYGPFLASDVLKVAHHGGATGTTDQFLDAVHPRHAAISVGKRNKFGHPSPVVLGRLARRGIEVSRTDLEGALLFESDGISIRRSRWRDDDDN